MNDMPTIKRQVKMLLEAFVIAGLKASGKGWSCRRCLIVKVKFAFTAPDRVRRRCHMRYRLTAPFRCGVAAVEKAHMRRRGFEDSNSSSRPLALHPSFPDSPPARPSSLRDVFAYPTVFVFMDSINLSGLSIAEPSESEQGNFGDASSLSPKLVRSHGP